MGLAVSGDPSTSLVGADAYPLIRRLIGAYIFSEKHSQTSRKTGQAEPPQGLRQIQCYLGSLNAYLSRQSAPVDARGMIKVRRDDRSSRPRQFPPGRGSDRAPGLRICRNPRRRRATARPLLRCRRPPLQLVFE